MMENTRPVGILRYNAEVMRNNGAPQEVIAKYLKDNGSSFMQISAVPHPNDEQVARMLQSEKDGTFAAGKKTIADAAERIKKAESNTEKLAIAQGIFRGIGDGLLWGTADEIESAIMGQPVKEIRAEQAQFMQKHPVLGIGSVVTGAMLNPTGTLGGAARGASLGEKVLRGAIQGGAQGALYGFGSGEGLENRLETAAKRGSTGAVVGAAVPVAVEGIKAVGRGIADVAGLTSGAGGESLKRGFDAGMRKSDTFKNAMRGKSGVYDVVDDVDKAVRTMERNATAKYKAMLPDNGATLKLSDGAFKNALKEATDSISGVTAGVDDTATNAINKVHKLAANIKAKGGLTFDNALEAKKAIDGIIEPLARSGEKNAVRLLTPIKNALNETMETAVPAYNGARAAFRADARLIDSIKGALTSRDPTTELRKIQGITRQSVAAAQGGKQELGRILDEVSNGRILDAVAGGQVQQLIPRDPVRAVAAGGAALSAKALSANPLGVATLGAFSPRLLGEISYALGRAGSKIPTTRLSYPALRVIEALKTRFKKGA
jgi:hypothetical protein